MDCSVLKELVYGKGRDGYMYDCEDFFEFFLKGLTRTKELRKLDFHYYYRGEELIAPIMKQLPRFESLEELRFGEHDFSAANLATFANFRFENLRHISIPMYR